jgi:hypothetical protein
VACTEAKVEECVLAEMQPTVSLACQASAKNGLEQVRVAIALDGRQKPSKNRSSRKESSFCYFLRRKIKLFFRKKLVFSKILNQLNVVSVNPFEMAKLH